MTKPTDDYEAVRVVVAALEEFDSTDQNRIIRWAREKLGLQGEPDTSISEAHRILQQRGPQLSEGSSTQLSTGKDLKAFVTEKNPSNDVQFAATVAYFYRFEAPQTDRKGEINRGDLQEGCRLASRKRLVNPGQTLRNAHHLGLLDKGTESGAYTINSVGENLVAMTLPGKPGSVKTKPKGSKRATKRATKRSNSSKKKTRKI